MSNSVLYNIAKHSPLHAHIQTSNLPFTSQPALRAEQHSAQISPVFLLRVWSLTTLERLTVTTELRRGVMSQKLQQLYIW